MKPHKHAELIKAWADGATIQYKYTEDEWVDAPQSILCWSDTYVYRIKPESKPDVVRTVKLSIYTEHHLVGCQEGANIKLTFDGETHALKSAEVLK